MHQCRRVSRLGSTFAAVLFAGLLVTVVAVQARARAQDLDFPPPPSPIPDGLPIAHSLWRAHESLAGAEATSGVAGQLGGRLLHLRDGKVHVEVRPPPGLPALPDDLLERLGGPDPLAEVVRRSSGMLAVPLARLLDVARELPEGYVLAPTGVPHADFVSHAELTNSAPYRDAGTDGSGITVAVIDIGFRDLSESQAEGLSPPPGRVTVIDLDPGTQDFDPHGVRCLERVYDHCPGATFRLYRIADTLGLLQAVDDCLDNGVDIISMSLSFFNEGWEDDEGAPCAAANRAAEEGILFFTSAGNYREGHWQGSVRDADGDNWLEFAGGDESIDVELAPGAAVTFYLSWPRTPLAGPLDRMLDLYLFNQFTGEVRDASVSLGHNFERVTYESNCPCTLYFQLSVAVFNSAIERCEIFMAKSGDATWAEHIVPSGSTTSPSNSTQENVISVGAVTSSRYFQGPDEDVIATYSSVGPTNGGRRAPDLVAPSGGIADDPRPEGFAGTSGTTPNAAGTAAVLWSCDPSMPAWRVRRTLFCWAEGLKDWGDAGPDTVYGAGGVILPARDDCNDNTVTDACDIVRGVARDGDCDGVPDFCDGRLFAGDLVITPGTVVTGAEDDPIVLRRPRIFLVLPPWFRDRSVRLRGLRLALRYARDLVSVARLRPGFDLERLLGERVERDGAGGGGAGFDVTIADSRIGVEVSFGPDGVAVGDGVLELAEVDLDVDPEVARTLRRTLRAPLEWIAEIDGEAGNAAVVDGVELRFELFDGEHRLVPPGDIPFRRGDVDASGGIDVTDAVIGLDVLFRGRPQPACLDAADANDDGRFDISDPVYSLQFAFLGGPEPPPPGNDGCGVDPTEDDLYCRPMGDIASHCAEGLDDPCAAVCARRCGGESRFCAAIAGGCYVRCEDEPGEIAEE